MNTQHKQLFIGLGVIVIFLLGYAVWSKVYLPREGESLASLSGTERAQLPAPAAPAAENPSSAEPVVPSIKKPATSATSDYEKALNEYRAKGAYFQFVNCAGNPGSLTLKRGTIFMLDNRDSKAHKIKVGKTTYNVAGYGYRLINPQTLGLNQITCDGGGAAVVNVQR